ncbi:mannose-6-phosphate isomerase [Dipodascopsis tothii]|uniref:mannose-6-phosphate isomerase n=1 Tax=Dipodascopsis tothii TaxID=44089 RepID=UPI0034CEE636
MSFFQLQCGAQPYDWGKLGQSSAVARFAAATDKSFSISAETPYAELWMGTHPSLPSREVTSSKTLAELLAANDQLVGASVAGAFDTGSAALPFLFKVLSIRKVLSIQAHPNKKLAKVLHANDPKNYPDDNHKPEMALAITPFEGFCGFRPVAEIKKFLETVPAFAGLVGAAGDKFVAEAIVAPASAGDEAANKALLRELFTAVMTASDDAIKAQADVLLASVADGSFPDATLADLITRLNAQFPRDIGLFCGVFCLNYVSLAAGEGMFLNADDPHAYISGDIIECMAASDNVVRAGFTPKFKDVPNLVSMLTYETGDVSAQKMTPAAFPRATGSGTCTLYDPPIPEFAVLKIECGAGQTVNIDGLAGPSIVIVTEGDGSLAAEGSTLAAAAGSVYFVGAGTELAVAAGTGLICYRAFVEA